MYKLFQSKYIPLIWKPLIWKIEIEKEEALEGKSSHIRAVYSRRWERENVGIRVVMF